jgi:DNA-binding CsgD family transcriptional regulator
LIDRLTKNAPWDLMVLNSSPALVGRDNDLAFIEGFLKDIPEGFTALVIEGDAGIGKTTLWQAALQISGARQYQILIARPTEAETGLSFAGLVDLLAGLPARAWSELPPLQRLALEAALLRTETESPVESGAISIAFLSVVRTLARLAPVVIAIDDYQWLDRPTARVIEFTIRRLRSEPVGVALAHRPAVSMRDGFERALGIERIRRLEVKPLSLSGLYHLIHSRLGAALGRPLLLRVHETSGGNPFFALELARALLERADSEYRGRPLPVPERINDLLRQRLGRLPARTQRLLLITAAMSSPRLDDLRRAVEHQPGLKVAEELERAERAGIVEVKGGTIRFTHPLLAAAAYDAATSAEQRRIHRSLAGVVTDPEEQARHMALSSSEPEELVAMTLDEASTRAHSRGATDVAAQFGEQALELTPPEERDQIFRRALNAGTLALSAGDHARARALFGRALAASAPGSQRATALLREAELASPLRDGVALCEQALAEAGEDPSLRSLIHRTLGAVAYSLGNVSEAERNAREAVRLAEVGDDGQALGMALSELGHWTFCGGGGIRRDLFERALTLEGSSGAVSPRSHLAKVTMDSGILAEARSQLKQLLVEAMGEGDLQGAASHQLHLAELEMWAGNWLTAIDHADESLLLHEHTDQPSAPRYVKAMSNACLGHIEKAREEAEAGLAEAEKAENVVLIMQTCHVLGFVELSLGNHRAALIHLGRATELLRTRWNREFGDCRFVPDETESVIALGDLERAEELISWMEEVARATRRPWTLATSARCRGLLLAARGDAEGADRALGQAVRQHENVPMPFELARTLLVKGAWERRRKHRAAARATLQQALAIFLSLGSAVWAENARGELARIGVRSRALSTLTPIEERVARLAAEGHNNREIAGVLFVSRKTVEANLSHIYRKLGIRSRAQLGAALSQTGTPSLET